MQDYLANEIKGLLLTANQLSFFTVAMTVAVVCLSRIHQCMVNAAMVCFVSPIKIIFKFLLQ
jgi:hypothetical protein